MALVISVAGYTIGRTTRAATLPGDVNNDGVVNVFDLSIMLSDWGTNNTSADVNNDGTVNVFDLSTLLSNWGKTSTVSPTPTPAASPTPSTGAWACVRNGPVKDSGGWNYSNATDATGALVDSDCFFPQDTAHFTGQNDTGGDLTNSVGPDVWSPTCTDAHGNIVSTDDPACVTPSTTKIEANSAQNYVITNNTPAGHTSVSAYSNVWAHGYTGVLDDYKTLTSSYNLSMPVNANTQAWAMQDDWLKEPNSTNDWADYELMVQYDFANKNADCPSTWDNGANAWGVVAHNVMIDGVAWHVCDGENPMHADGTCDETLDDACGAIVFKLGATENDRPTLPNASGTIDLKAMIQWLENNNVPGQNYPFIQKGSSIANLSAGWEICTTGGIPEQFVGKGFTVNATH
jgi:hypothetical protein